MTQIIKKLCLSPEGGELWSLSSDFMVVLNDGTITPAGRDTSYLTSDDR